VTHREETRFSWNEILSALGPVLIGRASEQRMKDKLVEIFINRRPDWKSIYNAYMRDEGFQKVKLQLRSLGIIGEAGVQGQSGEMQWSLTPYGDHLLSQIAAIRSSAKRA
jgi:hypothetical protein